MLANPARRYQEKSQNLYKATHAFLALLLFELPMGVFFGIVCYLCMWIPVGWGYDAPDRLARAVLLFMVASNAYRSLFTVVQLSSKSSSGPRIIALMSLLEATGGLYMKFKSIPMFCRWVCFINPTFYTMMGLVQIEYQGYLYPKYEVGTHPATAQHLVTTVFVCCSQYAMQMQNAARGRSERTRLRSCLSCACRDISRGFASVCGLFGFKPRQY